MKEFLKEAIKEMRGYLENVNFYTKKGFGKLTGLECCETKKEMVNILRKKIAEDEDMLKNL